MQMSSSNAPFQGVFQPTEGFCGKTPHQLRH